MDGLYKKNKGFSLVELIIVIAIMAVLAGALAPALIKFIKKSRYSKGLNNAETFKRTVQTSIADAASGESDISNFNVQYLSSTAAAPDSTQAGNQIICNIYNTLNPKGGDFEAIAIVKNLDVIQVTYKDLKSGYVFVWYNDSAEKYGSKVNQNPGEWKMYETEDGDPWVGWYSIYGTYYGNNYNHQYWNGH